ncbi:DUF2007 domain-containing protein [bacterium]|nr:DUF2007 domain-containing protein [bacterium]
MTQSHPEGYTLVYTSEQPEFADLIRSVLQDEGFSVFEAHADGGGIFRISWGTEIFVEDEHAEEARTFLESYLNRQAAETPAIEEDGDYT